MGAQGVCNALVGVRSPVGPPKFCDSAADNSILGCNIMYQLGEKHIPFKARSYNGHYLGLSIRRREFDSPTSRQSFCVRV